MKPDVYIRRAFDTACLRISRTVAARILRGNRRFARRVPVGWKTIVGLEPAVISHKPIDLPVNF